MFPTVIDKSVVAEFVVNNRNIIVGLETEVTKDELTVDAFLPTLYV